jgi:hypothetical protein
VKALAYYNWGRWVADCPTPGCGDARAVFPEDRNGTPSARPQLSQLCARGHAMSIEMPPENVAAQIAAVLADRDFDADRAWYPTGHPGAAAAGHPTGQSIADLILESQMVLDVRAAQFAQAD